MSAARDELLRMLGVVQGARACLQAHYSTGYAKAELEKRRADIDEQLRQLARDIAKEANI